MKAAATSGGTLTRATLRAQVRMTVRKPTKAVEAAAAGTGEPLGFMASGTVDAATRSRNGTEKQRETFTDVQDLPAY